MQGIRVSVPEPVVSVDWCGLGVAFSEASTGQQAQFLWGFAQTIIRESWGSAQLAYMVADIKDRGFDPDILEVLKGLVDHLEAEES